MPKLIERMIIVDWYTPEEKAPEEGKFTVVSISGQQGNIHYDHTFAIAEYWKDEGWVIDGMAPGTFEVIAWCDLEPYGGREAMEKLLGGK